MALEIRFISLDWNFSNQKVLGEYFIYIKKISQD